jgi:phospholipid transport system transporter-binding protein
MISLPATLTISEARAALASLSQQLAASSEPVLDASALRTLDTSAVAVLLACQRQVQQRGQQLVVRGAPAKLSQLAQLYGVQGLLALQD